MDEEVNNTATLPPIITDTTIIEVPPAINLTSDMQSNWLSMVPIVLIFLVMYFLLIRPQDKKRRQQEEMIKAVKKGDLIVTVGGIYGTIFKVNDKESTVILEVAKDTHLKVARSAIAEFIAPHGKKIVMKD